LFHTLLSNDRDQRNYCLEISQSRNSRRGKEKPGSHES
jgi:hypothetical protein